jgi:hypothetical protein
MSEQGTKSRARPTLAVVMAGSLLLVLVALAIHWMNRDMPPSSSQVVEAPVAAAPATTAEPAAPTLPAAAIESPALENQYGIQVFSIGLLLDGAAVLLRYKVVAPDKAVLMADDNTPSYLVDQASGVKTPLRLPSPTGAVSPHSRARSAAVARRQDWAFPPPRNKLIAGADYSLVLPNTAQALKKGSKVALVIGEVRVEDLPVQ